VCLGALVGVSGALAAADGKSAEQDLFLKGDAKCTSCHDELDSPGVLRLGKTKHGTATDSRNPTCTSCHGSSEQHIKTAESGKKDLLVAPDVTFGAKTKSPAEARDNACLTCHQNDAKRMFWKGSQHQSRDVVCSSCHKVHAAQDPVRDKHAQTEVCFTCHKEQRALAEKPSHHPVIEGKMACSSCHNPHGSAGPKLLVKDSVTGTCYTCHAEKRGPFVFSHQPVTDDCSNCHNPHGTTADAMLKTRPPFLCLSCHDPSSHPGNVPGVASQTNMSKNAGGTVLSATTPADNINSSGVVGKTQGMSCMNCHTDIHGSNNPMNSTRALRFWR
jgi:DmsE family decaheme c-type cytochrome